MIPKTSLQIPVTPYVSGSIKWTSSTDMMKSNTSTWSQKVRAQPSPCRPPQRG